MMLRDRDLVPAKSEGINWKRLIASILLGALIGFGASKLVHRIWMFPLKVTDTSMEPTIHRGSTLYIKRHFNPARLIRGDVVLLHHPDTEHYYLLLRVAGLPGDRVEIRDGELFINGELVPDSAPVGQYRQKMASGPLLPASLSPRDNAPPITLAKGSFYLLADNREHALDSRYLGPIPQEKIAGIAE